MKNKRGSQAKIEEPLDPIRRIRLLNQALSYLTSHFPPSTEKASRLYQIIFPNSSAQVDPQELNRKIRAQRTRIVKRLNRDGKNLPLELCI
jgi:hypothetical protein